MAVIQRQTFASQDGLMSFINGLNNPIVTSYQEGDDSHGNKMIYVSVDGGRLLLSFRPSNSRVYLKVNGNAVIEALNAYTNGLVATVISFEGFFYMYVKDSGNVGITLLAETVNGVLYTGGGGSISSNAIKSINSLTMYNPTEAITYTHVALLNYIVGVTDIDYANDIVISSGVKIGYNPVFLTCTTVTVGSVITFNNKNYFSIGTNTLIPIDEE